MFLRRLPGRNGHLGLLVFLFHEFNKCFLLSVQVFSKFSLS